MPLVRKDHKAQPELSGHRVRKVLQVRLAPQVRLGRKGRREHKDPRVQLDRWDHREPREQKD